MEWKPLATAAAACDFRGVMIEYRRQSEHGGMAEWLKAAVLKTASRAIVTGVRIPLPPPFYIFSSDRVLLFLLIKILEVKGCPDSQISV